MSDRYSIPEFKFAGFYYLDILELLISSVKSSCDELTEDNEREPFIQILRAFAFAHHMFSAELDIVAEESVYGTAKIRESVNEHLKLIAARLLNYSPSSANLLAELTRTFAADTPNLVPVGARFGTRAVSPDTPVEFEVLTRFDLDRTDRLAYIYAQESGSFSINKVPNLPTIMLFATPEIGDAVYFGHRTCMFNRIDFDMNFYAGLTKTSWEYYADKYDVANPDSVAISGDGLKFKLDTLLGTHDRTGLTIRVRCLLTGLSEDKAVTFDGSNNYITTDARLGQVASPSTGVADYDLGGEWLPVLDGSASGDEFIFGGDGYLSFPLPQDENKKWLKCQIEDSDPAYFLRFRVIAIDLTGPVGQLNITTVSIEEGLLYILLNGIQGRTVIQSPLGSGGGIPFQEITLARIPYIEDSLSGGLAITEGAVTSVWTETDTFATSGPNDNHYMVKVDEDGYATIICGDGTNGRVFPNGSNNIAATYRIGATENGNLATLRITENLNHVAYLRNIYNPRPAIGWTDREGGDDSSLEMAKITVPARTLRLREAGASPDTLDRLLKRFTLDDGSKPVKRVRIIEEVYGAKTIGAVLVGAGGYAVDSEVMDSIDEHFNGDDNPDNDKRIIANNVLSLFNYEPKTVNVVVEVWGGDSAVINDLLYSLLMPDAIEDDGITFTWRWGATMSRDRINAEVFKCRTGVQITKVNLTTPAADVELGQRELPKPGSITVVMKG